MNTQQMFLASLLLLGVSSATAYTKVINDPLFSSTPHTVEKTVSTHAEGLQPIAVPLSKRKHPVHAVVLAPMLTRPSLGKFGYSTFNNKPLIDWVPYGGVNPSVTNPQPLVQYAHKISLDYSIEYHYRPLSTFSFGLAFDRVQVSSMNLDLHYNKTNAPTDYNVIAHDLVLSSGDSDNLAIGNFYQPKKLSVRTYTYAAALRAYVAPQLIYDPFFQFGLGIAHNRGAIHRNDLSVHYTSSDSTWVWSVGTGLSYPVSEDMLVEFAAFFRNQHGFKFGDELMNMTNAINSYAFTGLVGQYYTYNFRLALKKTW